MTRWRLIVVVLILIALGLWGVLFRWNLRPELMQPVPRPEFQFPGSNQLQEPLSRLPTWATSLGLFLTLFLAGLANFYVFPARVRNMCKALGSGWWQVVQLAALGLGFVLLLLAFAVGAVLARITFPFAILSALALFFISVWGHLAVAYAVGRCLLSRAGWQRSSPALSLALGLLLLLPLTRIPVVGTFFMIVYVSLSFGLVIATHFGSEEPWNLTPLLEEDNQ